MNIVVPSRTWMKLISEKADLVIEDISEPTIAVKNHYQKIATKFANEQYKIYSTKAIKAFNKAYTNAVEKMTKFYNDMINKMEKAYNTFLAKYGDMTWEQVGDKIYKFGEAKYNEAKTKALAELKKLKALLEKAMVYYGDAEDLYKQAEAKAIVIYKANKNKTLKALYNEASEIIIDMALTNYGIAKKQVDKKVAELKTETMKQVAEMKVLAKKYYKEVP